MNRQLQELDLTYTQGHIIGFLAMSREPPCARDLETAFGLSHATVSGLLSRMEAKGFIQLLPDTHDRRVRRIQLLGKGMACSQRIRASIDGNEQLMVRGFTPEEIALFHSFLQRTAQNLSDPIDRKE